MSPQPISNENVVGELRSIATKHNGILLPEDVIKAAKNPNSPLHSRFEWDNDEAAHQYRIYQARVLIRTVVEFIEVDGRDREINVFCSLTSDREKGGGYRETSAVLARKELREQLLADALKEMRQFVEKYQNLKKLSSVTRVMKKILNAA